MIDQELRHGYTLGDVERMTRAAVVADRMLAMPSDHRRDLAWEAIVLAPYEADEPPLRQQLIRTGWQAIYAHIRTGLRERGYGDERDWSADGPNRPRFVMFWGQGHTPDHADRIIESIAVRQVVGVLRGPYRDAVLALASTDDYQRAAQALSISYDALIARLVTARKRIDAAWYGAETPPRQRRTDRRVESHGTPLATHCSQGHEWTPENTVLRQRIVRGKLKRQRSCRACQRERDRARHRKQAGERAEVAT